MANLGTLDVINSMANAYANQAIKNGDTAGSLGFLLGTALGGYQRKRRDKRDNEKLDAIINSAKANPNDPGYVADENGIYAGIGNGPTVQEIASMGEPTISVGDVPTGVQQGVVDNANIINAANNANNILAQKAAEQTKNATPAMNPNYTWDYIQQEARKQGIGTGVLNDRKAGIQTDIAQQARDILLPQIEQNMLGKVVTDKNGKQTFQEATTESYLNGLKQLNELEKYDPNTAKAYKQQIINMVNQDRQANVKLRNAYALAEYNQKNAIARQNNAANNKFIYNTTNNNRANGQNLLKQYGFSNMKDLQDAIDKFKDDSGKYVIGNKDDQETLTTLLKLKKSILGIGSQQENNTTTTTDNTNKTNQTKSPQQKPAGWLKETVTNGLKDVKYNDFNSVMPAYMGLHNELIKGGYSEDQATDILASTLYKKVKAGELNADDYRGIVGDFKPQEELTDDALLETDKKLHPDKYNIDSLEGVKNFFAGKFDDSAGKKIHEDYLANIKNQ